MNRQLNRIMLHSTALSLLVCSVSAQAIDPNAVSASAPAPVLAASDTRAPGKGGFLSGVLGCSAEGNKQQIGAIAGGVIGGLLGNRIGGRGGRTWGTILGGVLGAAGGSWLGCKLQQKDQEKAERALEDTVATGKDQSWSSDESGASGKVEQVSAPALSGIRFASNVEPADSFTKVSGAYVATTTANIRSSPSTTGSILGTLSPGQRVWVPAEVSGKPWVLVSEDGVARGYVAKSLMQQASTATAPNCKLVKQTISVPGSADQTETLQACKDKSGEWVMTRV